jgi:glucosamine 6-phosphate synthetase-like amidotransferase/phosphosugar isomerase protein
LVKGTDVDRPRYHAKSVTGGGGAVAVF